MNKFSRNVTSKNSYLSLIAVLVAVLGLGACASTPDTIPFAVQSDPLGAHVLFKSSSGVDESAESGDWIYLGVTPVDLRRRLGRSLFKSDDAFTLRVLKDGYLEQRKTWGGDDMKEQMNSIGKVFWNPRLVPNGQ
jgi:hypothetical protein